MNSKATIEIEKFITQAVADIKQQVKSRSYRAAMKIRNASNDVLSGDRSGKIYRVPGSRAEYQASAPGESPAVRTGHFRGSWAERVYAEEADKQITVHSTIESKQKAGKYLLGELLESGTKRGMAARPYQERVKEKAMPEIESIYNEAY